MKPQPPHDEPSIDREQLEMALDAAGIGLWVWDIASDRLQLSRQASQLLGLPACEFEGRFEDFRRRVHPDDVVRVSLAMKAAFEQTTGGMEEQHRLASDPSRWVHTRGRVIFTPEGRPKTVVGALVDVTEQREQHVKLRLSEERYRLFTELASDYVYHVDMRKRTLAPRIVAGSFERTTGYTPEEVAAVGGWTNIMHPDDRSLNEELTDALHRGRPFVNEYRILTKDGSSRWLRDRALPILDPQTGELVEIVGGVQDISDRKRLEVELSHAQKLDALARLAGAVAHDFNNLLTVMIGTTELLAAEVDDHRVHSAVAELQGSFADAAELTSSLLAFARRRPTEITTMQLDAAVANAVPMLQRAVGERIRVEARYGAPGALVALDRTQFGIALLNLAINARDAMPEGGSLKLVTSVCPRDHGTLTQPTEVTTGAYAVLEVADTGVGIPSSHLSQIFEPFFTTKGSAGTGLGLSTVHGIIGKLEGTITARSQLGVGTTFRIQMPMASGAPSDDEQFKPLQHAIGGVESIVVVEDDPRVLESVTRTLSELGYRVTGFESAEAALSQVEALTRARLLLTDVRLRGVSGVELAKRAEVLHSSIQTLLMSGYVEDRTHAALIEQGRYAFLHKPFTAQSLARRVREILDKAPSSWSGRG